MIDPRDFGVGRTIQIAHRLTGWNAVQERCKQLKLNLTPDQVLHPPNQPPALEPLRIPDRSVLDRPFPPLSHDARSAPACLSGLPVAPDRDVHAAGQVARQHCCCGNRRYPRVALQIKAATVYIKNLSDSKSLSPEDVDAVLAAFEQGGVSPTLHGSAE